MEWAIDAQGRLWWLEARPITTGALWQPPVVFSSAVGADDGPVRVWTSANVRESIPDPLHPLSWSVMKRTIVPLTTRTLAGIPESSPLFAKAGAVDLVDGRVYFNLNGLLSTSPMGRIMRRFIHFIDARTAEVVRALWARRILRPRRIPGAWRAALRGAFEALFAGKRERRIHSDPVAALAALVRTGQEIRERPPLGGLTDEELLKELLVGAASESAALRQGIQMGFRGFLVWLAATRAFKPWPAAARLLAVGTRGNPTTDISLAIDALVTRARPMTSLFLREVAPLQLLEQLRAESGANPDLRGWLALFDQFLERNGHRTTGEFDLATPRWAEDPTMIVELVRAGLRAADAESLEARLARLREERERRIAEALAEAPFWRRGLMRWLSRSVLAWMPLREAPKHHFMQALYRARLAALELGRRLRGQGLLSSEQDVFFLEYEQLEGLLRGDSLAPGLISERAQSFERCRRRAAPDIVRSDGVPVEEEPSPERDGALRGVGIGGGVGEGPVKILDEPDPSRVAQGDVLVVTFADSSWTPLFPRASAVVMEVGGTMCHAAVVARELGVPAVFGVRDAKKRLAAGQRVRVDGDAGTVCQA